MNKTSVAILFFVLTAILTSNAQIKFKPPKIKKQVDTTQTIQKKPASPINPAVVPPVKTDSSSAAVVSKTLLASDSIGLPIPDSIVIPLIDFNNQAIQDVLRLLSAPYNINMSVDPGLKAKVTLRLTKIKLKEAIAFIIRENGYAFRVKNSIIQVFEPPALPPPPPPALLVPVQVFSVKNDLLTVDLKNAELDSVIRWIAAKANRNIISEKGMKATLTAFFTDLPVDKGLKTIFETNGLELSIKDGLTYLIPAGGGFDEQLKEKPSRMKYFVFVKKNRVSFNVNNAPIGQIIREIASQTNLQIYMYSDLSGNITARVDSVSIDEAFESLLRNTSSTYWLSKGVYFFADKSMYEKKVVDLIPINYLQVDDVIGLLPNTITSKASIKKVKEYNAMLVEAPTSDIIEQVKAFATLLDKPIAQILIEAWVVEIKVDKLRQYGLKLFKSTPGQATSAQTYYPPISLSYQRQQIVDFLQKSLNIASNIATAIPDNFAAQIDALENEGISNLISKPQIATLNGHAATITFGTTQFYTLEKSVIVPGGTGSIVEKVQEQQTLNVNMTLAVTPWVSSNNEVTMEISPTFDVPGASPGPNTPPPVNRRSLNSTVRVKSGEMIVLGGLIGDQESQTIDKVPFLGDIPILKWIFSTRKIEKSKTQLMIYLIPHVYYSSERNVNPSSIDPKAFNKSALPEPIKKQTKRPWWK
jgi:type II secretory pathway component GspD/PulD (secretin)